MDEHPMKPYMATHPIFPHLPALISMTPSGTLTKPLNSLNQNVKWHDGLERHRTLAKPCAIGFYPYTGIPIVRSTVQPISEEQHRIEETKLELKALDEKILNKLGESLNEDSLYDLNDPNVHADDPPEHITP